MKTRAPSVVTDCTEAMRALQPFYDAEDDGDAIAIALDSVAGVFSRAADLDEDRIPEEMALVTVLRSLPNRVATGVVNDVEECYRLAVGGEYGAGLSESAARTVNELVETLYDALLTIARRLQTHARHGKPVSKSPRPKQPPQRARKLRR